MSFSVYRSSAGSGKTFSLVLEYLNLVLPDPEQFRHILAITFTNKVANEMKERILVNLNELAKPAETRDAKISENLLPLLIKQTKLDEQTIAFRANQARELILHNYSDFAISTIDSFSHRIIRTFAHDFGLPINFSVELDTDDLFKSAIDLLIDKVGDDEELTDLLVKFLDSRMDEERSYNIDETLLHFAKVLLDEEAREHIDKLRNLSLSDFQSITKIVYVRIGQFEEEIRLIASRAVSLINNLGIPASSFYYGTQGISVYFSKLMFNVADCLDPNSRVRDTIGKNVWTSGKAPSGDVEKINGIRGELENYYEMIRREAETNGLHYYLMRALTRTIFPITMLNEIEKILDEFKKQNNLVHISEFNRRISGFILNEPVPFIYERLGEKFSHILIDEFQDTSVLQWNNLLPLVENALAYGQFNMVVGDGKQAIYRWRNGDVDQFVSLPAIPSSDTNPVLKAREKSLKDNFNEVQLQSNFRSKAEIVKFNNDCFSSLRSLLDGINLDVYKDLEQQFNAENTGGFISLEMFGKEEEGQDYRERVQGRILELISQLKTDGFRLKDIAILCRRNADASEIARYLVQNSIDVISAESLLLNKSPDVTFIISFIRLFEDMTNIILQAELITNLQVFGKIRDVALDELLVRINSGEGDPGEFFRIINENGVHLDPGRLELLPLYDFCNEIIRLFSLNRKANPYIQFFLDYLLKFSRRKPGGRADFLEWWETHSGTFSVVVPGGMDAVNIMSIHKSKGLQFPAVILPVYADRTKPTKEFIWVDIENENLDGLKTCMLPAAGKDMAKTVFAGRIREEEDKTLLDAINVLYVAMTRPEEQLHIISPLPPVKSDRTRTIPGFLAHFLKTSGIWSEEKMNYEWGARSKHKVKLSGKELSAISPEKFLSSDWRDKVYIRLSAPETWDIADPQRNRQWGNLVHAVLSKIENPGDVENVLAEMVMAGTLEDGRKPELQKKVSKIFIHPEAKRFFTPGLLIRSEAEILLTNGSIYRPDRVIIDGGKAVVIDYKTGKPDPGYEKQLKTYGRLLMEMGYADVEKFILYLDPEIKLVRIE